MQRKPGFPASNCSIKMPDSTMVGSEILQLNHNDEEYDQKKRLQLINFGHSKWGFNNWSWAVTKQDVDFVDFISGKYTVGVAAFVSITVRSLNIHRENVGYATTASPMKGTAIYRGRKSAVTNALRETLLSFGGNITTELTELLESIKPEHNQPVKTEQENNQNVSNKPHNEIKNVPQPCKAPEKVVNNVAKQNQEQTKNMPNATPVAKTHPMQAVSPAIKPPLLANPSPQPRLPPPFQPRPNSNECVPPEREKVEKMTEEEMREERRRRQRQAQEEFRLKQMKRQGPDNNDADQLDLHRSSIDRELLNIPTQDIIIEDTGNVPELSRSKRQSPEPANSAKRRASLVNKLKFVED